MVKRIFFIITPPDNTFIYKPSVIWNSIKSIFKIYDPATSVSILKLKLKIYLLNYLEMLKIGLKTILSNYKMAKLFIFLKYIFFINFNHKILYFCFKIIIIFEK